MLFVCYFSRYIFCLKRIQESLIRHFLRPWGVFWVFFSDVPRRLAAGCWFFCSFSGGAGCLGKAVFSTPPKKPSKSIRTPWQNPSKAEKKKEIFRKAERRNSIYGSKAGYLKHSMGKTPQQKKNCGPLGFLFAPKSPSPRFDPDTAQVMAYFRELLGNKNKRLDD